MQQLSKEERKKWYFKSFMLDQQKQFTLSVKVYVNTDFNKMDTYMGLLKKDADKTYEKKKKKHETNKNKSNGNDFNSRKKGKNKQK